MILLDTTCLVYAVGDDHERRASSRALIDAAEYGDTRVIEVLLAAGADVAAKCEYHG